MTNKNKAKPEAVADMAEADNIIGNGKTYTGNDKPETKVLGVLLDPPTDQLRVPLPTTWARKKARSWDQTCTCWRQDNSCQKRSSNTLFGG